jgi:hypothetical protein
MLAEAIVVLVVVYACASLWPNITLALLSFAAGVAVDQYNPRTPRVHKLLAMARVAVARLLSRSDDLGTSISQVASSAVAMTSEQAKRLLLLEEDERHAEPPPVAAPPEEPTDEPAEPRRSVAQSIRERAVRFEQ